PCLPGEEVTFFTVDPTDLSAVDVVDHSCNQGKTCRQTLNQWVNAGRVDDDPIGRCEDPTRAVCDDELEERRFGKDFYRKLPAADVPEHLFAPLGSDIESAFRFKTRFVSGLDDDLGVGFTPVPCQPGSDAYPYCYAADEI